MVYFKCQNKDCINKGAPYHFEEKPEKTPDCPVCEQPMKSVKKPKGA